MKTLNPTKVVVAGGTGNVGAFIVRALLERGTTVVVPSRSEQKLREFRTNLQKWVSAAEVARCQMLVGHLGHEAGAKELLNQITDKIGAPDAVVAALGQWQTTPSLISAGVAQLEQVLRDYLLAHFVVARTFLPVLKARGGTYVFINGPLAFGPWEGTSLVSIACAAQQMLFKSLAKELDGSPARVVELVSYASLKDQQTQPSSPIPGEAVGAYVSQLVLKSSREMHGRSLQLRYLEQLKELGLAIENNGSSHQSNFLKNVETTRTFSMSHR